MPGKSMSCLCICTPPLGAPGVAGKIPRSGEAGSVTVMYLFGVQRGRCHWSAVFSVETLVLLKGE